MMHYYLAFKVKSDAPANIYAVFEQNHSPYLNQLYEMINVNTQAQTYFFDIGVVPDDDQIKVGFHIGNVPNRTYYFDSVVMIERSPLYHDNMISQTDNSDPRGMVVYPNPFRDKATIRFKLDRHADIRFVISSVSGDIIQEYRTGWLDYGTHTLNMSTTSLRPGVYFCMMYMDNQVTDHIKIICIRDRVD